MSRTTPERKRDRAGKSGVSAPSTMVSRHRILPLWFVVMSCSLVFSTAFGKWLIYPARGEAGSSLQVNFRVDVNHADVMTLAGLPGLGTTIGQRIVAHRQRVGRFTEPVQLTQIKGIGLAKLKQLEPWVICGPGVADDDSIASDASITSSEAAAAVSHNVSLGADEIAEQPRTKQPAKTNPQKSGGPVKEPPLVEDSVMSVELAQ